MIVICGIQYVNYMQLLQRVAGALHRNFHIYIIQMCAYCMGVFNDPVRHNMTVIADCATLTD